MKVFGCHSPRNESIGQTGLSRHIRVHRHTDDWHVSFGICSAFNRTPLNVDRGSGSRNEKKHSAWKSYEFGIKVSGGGGRSEKQASTGKPSQHELGQPQPTWSKPASPPRRYRARS